MSGTSEETLRQLQASPKDEFGVSHVNILFNPEADKVFCIIDAPSKDSVQKNAVIVAPKFYHFGDISSERY
jgi:hypothetical protein